MSLIARNSESRLAAGICVSLLVNAIVWSAASGVLRRRLAVTSPRLTFERVVIDRKTGVKRIKAPAKPKPVKKPLPKPLPKPRPVVRTDRKPPPPPPPADHHAIITAKPSSAGPKPDFQAPDRGTAKPGVPAAEQGPGVITPPKTPPPVVELPKAPPPVVEPPKPSPPVVEPPKPPPPVVEPPKPPPPPPPKVDPPKPKGPTRDAEPSSTVYPEIPDNLKSDDLKTFVRVKVHIQPDGSFEVILRTSSHNPEVDRIVLDALKRWKWKPALEDGAPVESTKLFKFEFEVK